MNERKGKIRWSATLALVGSAASVLAGPVGLALVGVKASAVAALAFQLIQAGTKPAVRQEHER